MLFYSLMFSYFEPNFIEKFLGKVFFFFFFFLNLAKIEMTQLNKNRLFGRHFETVLHFYLFIYLFFRNYGFRWETGFFRRGVPWLDTNRSKSTLIGHLSVNELMVKIKIWPLVGGGEEKIIQ